MKLELNLHNSEMHLPIPTFTIEFNVKNPKITVPDELWEREWITGRFTNEYGDECFEKIRSAIKSRTWRPENWCFTGRSNGWFCILCVGDETRITETQRHTIEAIVERFFKNYPKRLAIHYGV
jgi:hypothetical protein